MPHTFHVGDLVKVNYVFNPDAYRFAVILDIEQGANYCEIAYDLNRPPGFDRTIIDVASLQPFTPKLVIDGVITQTEYNKAVEFQNRMDEKKDITGTSSRISRAQGVSKKRRRGKKSNKRGRKTNKGGRKSSKRRRTMRR
jgi:hypothetical protein